MNNDALLQFVNDISDVLLDEHPPTAMAAAFVGGPDKVASVKSVTDSAGLPNLHSIGIAQHGDTPRVTLFATDPDAVTGMADSFDEVPVEIVQSAPAVIPTAQAAHGPTTERCRPPEAGISAGHYKISAGTIACYCHSTLPGERGLYALSNNHVFANVNDAAAGDCLLQPGVLDGGKQPDDVFATLARFVSLKLGMMTRNDVDAAIGKLSIKVQRQISSIGHLTGTKAAVTGMKVRKHGRTTGYTEGTISHIGYNTIIAYDSGNARFANQIRIVPTAPYTAFSGGGDSGSLIMALDSHKAVGLLFGGAEDGSYTLANSIDHVLAALNISIP